MSDNRAKPLVFFAALAIAAAVGAGCAGSEKALPLSVTPSSDALASNATAARLKTGAGMFLRIPPRPPHHRAGREISPNTRSLVVGVQLVTATSPWPSMRPQTYAVASGTRSSLPEASAPHAQRNRFVASH
jgi:hypothetical protein